MLKVDRNDDSLGGDDAYDAFRYGLMHATVNHRVREEADPFAAMR